MWETVKDLLPSEDMNCQKAMDHYLEQFDGVDDIGPKEVLNFAHELIKLGPLSDDLAAAEAKLQWRSIKRSRPPGTFSNRELASKEVA